MKRIGLKTDIGIGYDYDVEEKFRDLEIFYDVEKIGIAYAWIFGNVLIYDSLLNPKAISSWLITCLAQEEKSR